MVAIEIIEPIPQHPKVCGRGRAHSTFRVEGLGAYGVSENRGPSQGLWVCIGIILGLWWSFFFSGNLLKNSNLFLVSPAVVG